ncbi:MAG: hypothetical protein HQ508_05015 [Candidatus Marinimicrobia bacterium]|nr:hypothetical protein [Candidatus Neomarinimicrobiota bacterium]
MNRLSLLFSSTSLVFLISLQSCWMAPDRLLEEAASPDDFSVDAVQNPQDFTTFNDFITSVYQASGDAKQALVDSFMQWADATTGIPYIEESRAYFLYINGSSPQVAVAGDFCDWDPANQNFTNLSGTNLHYRSYPFESDARLDYKLVVDGNWILDPLNGRTCSGGYGPNSELSMGNYIQPPEIETYTIPHGTLISTSFSDTTQNRTRTLKIYTPAGYSEGDQQYRSIYFLDGSEYVTLGYARNVLDFMIAQELIPPVIAVFTDPTNRNSEYNYDYDFMEMFVGELVPWIDSQYRSFPESDKRAIAGVSLGGLTALLFTLQHPEVFGNCGAYSSAIWLGDLIEQYQNAQVQSVKIYMDAGTYESSIINSSASLQEILENNNWEYRWKVWHEGHSWGAWRAHLDESLTYFWPMETSGIDER